MLHKKMNTGKQVPHNTTHVNVDLIAYHRTYDSTWFPKSRKNRARSEMAED